MNEVEASSLILPVPTFCDSVQHHGDLLVVQQPFLQELHKHSVGEVAGAQLEGLGVLAAT